jgi:CRISPR-associated protein Cmr3
VVPEDASWENNEFMKIRLLTPGDFGGWVPNWLTPGDWCAVPGTKHEVKLRSAFVPGGFPVSGWDFKARGPKATRLLVPAGSVYVVQLRDPKAAAALARHLWLAPLVPPAGNRMATGFGHAVPGLLHHTVTPF